MDAVTAAATALGAAQGAWKLGFSIYEFILHTKNINETIHSLQAEVKQLGDVCNSVSEQIRTLPSLDQDDAQLLTGVNSQIVECNKTISKLDKALEDVHEDKMSFLKQAIRQMKFELSQSEIDEYRKQIHINVTNLQLSIQLLNLKATYLAPKLANEKLLEKLTDLQNAIDSQGQKLDQTLVQCAGNYLSQGTTLYAQSVASASVLGALPDAKHTAISDWVSKLNALRIDAAAIEPSTSSAHGSDDSPDLWNEVTPKSRTTIDTSTIGTESVIPDDDDDDELAIELATAAIDSGTEAFQIADFIEAESMFQEALTLIESLPKRLRSDYDLESLHFKLAVCSFHLHDLSTAEAALITVVERQSVSDEDALRRCEAGFLLAQVYVRQDKFDQARSTCESVYRGRRKLLKKDDQACHESLALLARIYTLLEKTSRANTYRSILPVDKRDHYCRLFDSLGSESKPPSEAENLQQHDDSALTPASTTEPGPSSTLKPEEVGFAIHENWGNVKSIACSPDNTLLVCGVERAEGGAIELRDIMTGECKSSLFDSADLPVPEYLAVSSDGVQLASYHCHKGSTAESIRIWSLESLHTIHELVWKKFEGRPRSLMFSPGGGFLACLWLGQSFRMWNTKTGQKVYRSSVMSIMSPQHMGFAPHQSYIDILSHGRKYRIDTIKFKTIWKSESQTNYNFLLAWASDGTFAEGGSSLKIDLYRKGTTQFTSFDFDKDGLADWPHYCKLITMGFMADSMLVAFALGNGFLAVSDVKKQRWYAFNKLYGVAKYKAPKDAIVSVLLSPDCSNVIVIYSSWTYCVFNVAQALQDLRSLYDSP